MFLRNYICFLLKITPSLKQSPLFISFSTLVFLSILHHTSLPTALPTVPCAVRVVVISLSFPSFNPQSINPLNSLVIVLLLMLPLFGMLFLIIFMCSPLLPSLENASKPTFTPRHTLVSLTPGVLCGAWSLFCPWIFKLVDCFCSAAP